MIRINTFLLIICCSIIITISGCATTSVIVPVPLGQFATLTQGDRVSIYSKKSRRYIELIVTEVIVIIRPGLKYDLSGAYVSDIKGVSGRLFPYGSPLITFEQNGNKILGTIAPKSPDKTVDQPGVAEIIGTRKGDTIKFKYRDVTGVWQVNSDSTKLDGTWDFSGNTDSSGTWNLNRVYYTSEMPDIAASFIKGELISDQTPVEVMVGDISRMHINDPIVRVKVPGGPSLLNTLLL